MRGELTTRYAVQLTAELHSKLRSVSAQSGASMLSVVEFLLYNKSEESIVIEMSESNYKPRRAGRPKKRFHTKVGNS